MSLLPRTLVARVAWTTALCAVLAGCLVALVAGVLSDRLAWEREDRYLADAAETFALELREPGADPYYLAKDEQWELEHAQIRVAIYEAGRFMAGDASVGWLEPGVCRDLGARRACARPAGPWSAIIARLPRAIHEQRSALWLSSSIAVCLTSVLGALLAGAVARRVLSPLWQLRAAVQQLPAEPERVDLGADADVLEVDALRASLRSAFTRLGIALTQSRRFASDAAHELRTPLTTILGELELAAELLHGEERDGIMRAHRVADRLSRLVDRLLILARLDPDIPHEELELRELVEDALDGLPVSARARIQIAPTEGAVPWVDGERSLLVTMVANALENALKFSRGGVLVQLSVRAQQAVLAVCDDGPGVSLEQRALVFSPFYRAPNARVDAVPGHGLGLALIAHVVALHRGRVSFLDAAQGAHLEVTLPAASRSL